MNHLSKQVVGITDTASSIAANNPVSEAALPNGARFGRAVDLFADLVAQFGEQNGGPEDFYVLSEDRIGCRYADLSMHRREDGWHYGRLPEAYPTPTECYAHWREDEARFHLANDPKLSDRSGRTGA